MPPHDDLPLDDLLVRARAHARVIDGLARAPPCCRRRAMTRTLAGADIRGYYAALGVQIPDWARTEASVRCFADPDTHRRGDHDPSCSVNLEHGAWHCHACGARGGAFDAARARGYSDRGAIDLMVAHRLTEYRATPASQRQGSTESRVDLHASGHSLARAAARDRGRHRPLAGRARSRHRPHRQAQP